MTMLNFGDGTQALHYFILCFASLLGTIQIAAARGNRREFVWLGARASSLFGAIAIVASFVWFLWVDEEIFLPGLAGGEIIAIFLAAFAAAVPLTRGVVVLAAWTRAFASSPRAKRVKEPSQ